MKSLEDKELVEYRLDALNKYNELATWKNIKHGLNISTELEFMKEIEFNSNKFNEDENNTDNKNNKNNNTLNISILDVKDESKILIQEFSNKYVQVSLVKNF